jgi:cell division transport system permease protein
MRLAIRDAVRAFRRAPLLGVLGIVTIAFSLFAFGLFGLVAVNLQAALRTVEERVEIRAFLADGTTEAAITAALGDIAAFPEVATIGLVSPDSALARAREELAEFSDVLDAAVLPAAFEIRLRDGFRDPENVRRVADRVSAYDFIDDVRYGREWVEKLYRIRTFAAAAGVALGTVFALVAAILIGATIRVAVLARSREIEIMRLVGATNAFVRRPYLVDGVTKGALGGVVAIGLVWITGRVVGEVLGVATVFFTGGQAALGIAAGALLGLVASRVAVGRQLRAVWRDAG